MAKAAARSAFHSLRRATLDVLESGSEFPHDHDQATTRRFGAVSLRR